MWLRRVVVWPESEDACYDQIQITAKDRNRDDPGGTETYPNGRRRRSHGGAWGNYLKQPSGTPKQAFPSKFPKIAPVLHLCRSGETHRSERRLSASNVLGWKR